MTTAIVGALAQSSICYRFNSPTFHLPKSSPKLSRSIFLNSLAPLSLRCSPFSLKSVSPRRLSVTCSVDSEDESNRGFQVKGNGLDLAILKRWEVPWGWQTVSLTSLAVGLSFVLTGLVETAAIPYLGLHLEELSLDDKAEILFVDQSITTAAVLVILYSIANQFQPLPEDLYRYGINSLLIVYYFLGIWWIWCAEDLRDPLSLQKGWFLWAGIGLVGALGAIAATGVAVSYFNGGTPPRETDALVRLLPLIGSSTISTACLLGITGVLAPLLEETVFRGFFMVSLTKWVPVPIAVFISASVFALAHLTPGEFPQLFVLGTALGFSYAHTRNLLTPITIHAFWNSGVILLLTFLHLQGYDIKELLQTI